MQYKSKYREPQPGDIADLRYHTWNSKTPIIKRGALILTYAASNVYESASCEVFHEGSIFWIETKHITLYPRDDVG